MENLQVSCVCPNLSRPYSPEKECESRKLLSPLCSGTKPWKNLRHHIRQSVISGKSSQLVAASGLPPPTHLHLATITHRETLVSPLAFNLAKQTYPTSPFGKQKCSFLYLFRIRLHGGAGQTRPGQGFPHKWVWYKQPRLRPRPGSNWIAPFWLSD